MKRPVLHLENIIHPDTGEAQRSQRPIDLTQRVVGVDLGDQKSLACVYSQGVIVEWFEFAMTPDGVRAAFKGKGSLKVALEAGAHSGGVTRLRRTLRYEPAAR